MADTFPRINGGMIQSGQFTGQLVSLVGKLVSHDKIQAADGTVVTLSTEQMNEQPIVNPDMVVEIMGQPSDETTFTGFVIRELSSDMDLGLYNDVITMMQTPKFVPYFSGVQQY
eukprot:CAMPEP_0113515042 /NCGR_PEP_ID=MMETSP0014_2-20120614/40727_1 /TAXON_ID=2857 /ORGANISM="Nitzschia sp." /LENGTH=113 /DNA_ID=CAMNT_0000411571 /DNA_START=78 /DNA_END=419 /DNA_ORIENTATION=+ /assembly_acc=CAM_ASM_000159